MIHHISIGAHEPERVARVLAELWNGYALPFPIYPGGWIAMTGNDIGTTIEVAPFGLNIVPGDGEPDPAIAPSPGLKPWEAQFVQNSGTLEHSQTHAALSSPLTEAEVLAIARREGWRAVHCERGTAFAVIEFWLENRLLIEVLPVELAQRYTRFMSPAALASMFGLPAPQRAQHHAA